MPLDRMPMSPIDTVGRRGAVDSDRIYAIGHRRDVQLVRTRRPLWLCSLTVDLVLERTRAACGLCRRPRRRVMTLESNKEELLQGWNKDQGTDAF